MTTLGLCVALLMAPCVLFAQTAPRAFAEQRPWTTTDGKVFPAALVKADGSRLTLRRADGQLEIIAIQSLSPGDRMFVKTALEPARSGGATGAITSARVPVEKRVWPETVEVDSRAIEVRTVRTEGTRQTYRSQAFEFVSEDRIAASVMKEVARTFEATRSLVEALPWGVDPTPPADLGFHQAHFYVSRQSYEAAGGPPNSGGVYFRSDRVFRVPFESLGLEMRGRTWFMRREFKNDALVHEITHQMMHDLLPFLPTWIVEGTAEYTEMLPYNAGRFLAGSHRRGIKEYIEDAAQLGVEPSDLGKVLKFMKGTHEEWAAQADPGGRGQFLMYYRSCLLVYYFSHLDGHGKGHRFLRYMDSIADARDAWRTFFQDPRVVREPDGQFRYPADLALPSQPYDETFGLSQLDILIDGRSAEELQKEVVAAFKQIGVQF